MGPEFKKVRKEQRNRHNNYHVQVMKEPLTRTQKYNKKYQKYDMLMTATILCEDLFLLIPQGQYPVTSLFLLF